jgi:tRNA pseudouridine55 synthase
LRRLQVGRFTEAQAISLERAVALGHSLAASEHLLPIETALDDIPALAVTAAEAARLRHGQRIPLLDPHLRLPANPTHARGIEEGALVRARHDRIVVALARIEYGALRPVRIINR